MSDPDTLAYTGGGAACLGGELHVWQEEVHAVEDLPRAVADAVEPQPAGGHLRLGALGHAGFLRPTKLLQNALHMQPQLCDMAHLHLESQCVLAWFLLWSRSSAACCDLLIPIFPSSAPCPSKLL